MYQTSIVRQQPTQISPTQIYSWFNKTFHNINWKAHRTLIHKLQKTVQILKGIHGWRPTKYRLHVINKKQKASQQENTTDLCPLCKQHQETQQHIFQCIRYSTRNLYTIFMHNLGKTYFTAAIMFSLLNA